MISITGHDQFTAWQNKVMPPVEEVRPGVWSIPVPFPGNPMRYTLAYLLLGDGEAALVDPGWESAEGWEALKAGFAAAGATASDITGVVATHYHPDHLGMAARLRAGGSSWMALGERERLPADWSADMGTFVAGDRTQFTAWGVPEALLGEVTFRAGQWEGLRSIAEPELRLADGAVLPVAGLAVRVLATPGHTPGHICLLDTTNSLLLTGDHVLPRITPHVSLEAHGHDNPVGDYLRSLDVLADGNAMEVLPAHEYRFRGLAARVAELRRHTLGRSGEVAAVLVAGNARTVWDVAKELTWSRGFDSLRHFTLRLALAETASHLVYLRGQGATVDIDIPRGASRVP
ncbi:MBL fold metallo-hydrolase [Arthrobacter sp. A2-55]|uniref:MBL fold metallo-hydrolase n=1 Tax=Arthrobacter sp. A2-55 TaxID=2897337 RepID=UPI0021CD8810|nr:MBL fold metallo-hydrolase [Arthrobacter sp. A2-55]MCU6480805.1 MBL fold metallo-hydrolase [Arthrobacter sp. A2-55]